MKNVLFLLEMPPFPCVFMALMCQSGLALTDSHSINQRNSEHFATFIYRPGRSQIPSFGLINSCFLVTS